jgi:hypothetical protein
MRVSKRGLPIPQHEFGFTLDTFNLIVETRQDGDRIARERRNLIKSAKFTRGRINSGMGERKFVSRPPPIRSGMGGDAWIRLWHALFLAAQRGRILRFEVLALNLE